MVKKKQEWMSFHEDGKRYMQCKVCQSEYVQTGEEAVAVTCSRCVTRITISHMSLEEMMPSLKKKTTGRPAGWHWMSEFIDKKGNVTEPEIIRSVHPKLDEEVLRVIKLVKFSPGVQNGVLVRVKMVQMVNFQLKR